MSKRGWFVFFGSTTLLAFGLLSLHLSRSSEPSSVIAGSTDAASIKNTHLTRQGISQASEPTTTKARAQPSIANPQSNTPEAKFELTRSCHWAAAEREQWALQLRSCRSADATDTAFIESCTKRTEGLDEKLDQADKELARCSPVPAEREENFYRSTIEAAKAGYPDAQLCYLASDFSLNRPFTDDELHYYHSVDAEYVNSAIDRGDWRMIALMATKYRDAARHATMRRELTGGDPFTLYQMNKLLSLGAEGNYKRIVENSAEDAATELTAAQIGQANDWVSSVYEKHFASSPRLTERPTICEPRM